MRIKPKKRKITNALAVILFALVTVFGVSILTGNTKQSNIGTSHASAQEPADINSDNKVDVFDLSILLSKWNTTDSLSDINKDNTVNVFDLSMLLAKWGAVGGMAQAMPTRDNTGPRYALTDMTPAEFYASRTCNRQRITGPVLIEQVWMRGQTFNITDCEITGNMAFYLIGGDQQLPAADMPIMNVAYTDILGGVTSQHAVKLNVDHSYIFGRVQMKLTDGWPITTPGYAPYVFTNSLLYNEYLSQPTHTETLQTAGYGTGTSFTNVVFLQQGGPLANTGVTATVNYVGDGTIFDGCYFLWDGETPAWYTVYISGPGVIVRNSWFDSAAGGYVYPNSPSIMPTFTNNRNYRTNQLLILP